MEKGKSGELRKDDATETREVKKEGKSHLHISFPHVEEEETDSLVIPGLVKEDEFD